MLRPRPRGPPKLGACGSTQTCPPPPPPLPSASHPQLFEEGQLDTRVPLTTRSGTKDAGARAGVVWR